jgi:hypothetical protein
MSGGNIYIIKKGLKSDGGVYCDIILNRILFKKL